MASQNNKVGRPLKFDSVEELQQKIEDYFNDCLPHPIEETYYEYVEIEEEYTLKGKTKKRKVRDYSQRPIEKKKWTISEAKTPTITGLAVFLDTSRRTLLDYETEETKSEYSHTIKKAKDVIEQHWESLLKGNNVTGVIFNLKNNYAWRDKTEVEATISDPRKAILEKYMGEDNAGKTKET